MVVTGAGGGCSPVGKPEPTAGRWIRFDPATQRYSVEALQVPRGALLDELKIIAKADIRPQLEREAPVTAKASGLDLDALIALLLSPDTHPTIRPGEREIAAAPSAGQPRKKGPPLRPAPGSVAKPDATSQRAPEPKRSGTLKVAADTPFAPREITGTRTKPPTAMLLRTAETMEPKKPLPPRAERATVRLVLQFEEGAPPRLIDAQTIEGRAPVQRFVTGTFLYALIDANGRLLEAGTFQDPLIERSYQKEGPHSARRAKTGVVGVSIAREHMKGARLQIVDMTGVPLPRELNEGVVRNALKRGRTSLQLETQSILRRLDQETKR
jgi:hypothetical protein